MTTKTLSKRLEMLKALYGGLTFDREQLERRLADTRQQIAETLQQMQSSESPELPPVRKRK
jgi:hypothetical protein